jgi:hypothetical protein
MSNDAMRVHRDGVTPDLASGPAREPDSALEHCPDQGPRPHDSTTHRTPLNSPRTTVEPQIDDTQDEVSDPLHLREGRLPHNARMRAEKHLKRAHVTIATLNMNSKSAMVGGLRKSKWEDLENMMKTRCMGIVALQETHLNDEGFDSFCNLYQQRLVIINSSDPDRPSQSAGVAFALNKDIVSTEDITVEEIIPGRALLLDITWRDGQRLVISKGQGQHARDLLLT